MIKRPFWINTIEELWKRRSIIWLGGLRRSGKTSLCKSLEDVLYVNCELVDVQRELKKPENFFAQTQSNRIVFDEIHVLDDPSRVLKIGADLFPEKKIIGTGSSTLGAQKKFSDTLTGRKLNLTLTPMLLQESALFGNKDIHHRMLYGGLPPFFLETELHTDIYLEWIASYFARDVQKLYRIENEASFNKFIILLLSQSGGIFNVSRFAELCGVSRPTITKYVYIAQQTFVAHIVEPYSSRKSTEISKAPRIYGFDTGFICYAKGWGILRHDEYGFLWEHIVLNNIKGLLPHCTIKYWRHQNEYEVDFILKKNRDSYPVAIECKWNSQAFNARNIKMFRKKYPIGKNFVIAHDIQEPYTYEYEGIPVTFTSLEKFPTLI